MAKLTLDDLKKIRDEKKVVIDMRESAGKDTEIIVAMATCGIAAGAKQILQTMITELKNRQMSYVLIRQSGCMGFCSEEPTVKVKVPGMDEVVYGKVDKDIAVKIITDHIGKKTLLDKNILNRTTADKT